MLNKPRALIVGLGNLGPEYEHTRHNIGFLVLNELAKSVGSNWTLDDKRQANVAKGVLSNRAIILAKPTTFMNESGAAVQKLRSYYKILPQDIIIIYDDIAFQIGDFRITLNEGTGGHKGIADVLEKIGGGFVKYRIGIGQKHNNQMDLKDYVLSNISEEECKIFAAKMPEILKYINLLLDKGVEHAMSLANRKKIL